MSQREAGESAHGRRGGGAGRGAGGAGWSRLSARLPVAGRADSAGRQPECGGAVGVVFLTRHGPPRPELAAIA